MLRCVSAILVTHRSDRQTFSLFAPLFCSARVLTMFRMGSARKRPTQRVSTHVVPEGLIAELNISELSTPGSANLRLFGSRQHNDPKAVFEGLEGASLQAALNHFSQLKPLLAGGCGDVNMRDGDGDRCPIHWAAARGHLNCLKMLLHAGADACIMDASGRTAEQLAATFGQEEARLLLAEWVLAPRAGSTRRTPTRHGQSHWDE